MIKKENIENVLNKIELLKNDKTQKDYIRMIGWLEAALLQYDVFCVGDNIVEMFGEKIKYKSFFGKIKTRNEYFDEIIIRLAYETISLY